MKSYSKLKLLILATLVVVSTIMKSQNLIEVGFDYNELSKFTGSADNGDLMVLDKCKSLVVIGECRIGIIDNLSGDVIKVFDDSVLRIKFDSIIDKYYRGQYLTLSNEEHKYVNTCTRQPYIYNRFYRIDSSNIYACEIWTIVKNLVHPELLTIIKAIAFFDENLNITKLYERDEDPNSTLMSEYGGFFISKNDFYIKKAVPKKNDIYDFVHFKLQDGKYRVVDELSIIEKSTKPDYYPGRFFSMFQCGDYYYVYNETNYIKTSSLDSAGKSIDYGLRENEIIGLLQKIDDHQVVGLRLEIDIVEGVAKKIFLFQSDLYFTNVRLLAEFKGSKFTVNSIKVFNKKIYLFLFDETRKKYLLTTVDIKNNIMR